MQCHFRLEDSDAPDRLDKAIQAYADEGVKVMLTELDVGVLPRRGRGADADPYAKGLPADVAAAQARYYKRIFEVVLKHPKVVTRVSLWGTQDGASWLNGGFGGRRTTTRCSSTATSSPSPPSRRPYWKPWPSPLTGPAKDDRQTGEYFRCAAWHWRP